MLEGGCFCGHVRYEAGGEPFHPTICHCSMCRRTAGAPIGRMVHGASLAVPPCRERADTISSSRGVTRTLLPTMRNFAHLRNGRVPRRDRPSTTASLDDPEAMPPHDHTHTATRLSWVRLADGLPVYPDRRAME